MANEVKHGSRAHPARGLSRHLEGWQLAVVSVGIALVGAALGIPRAVAPVVLPTPRVDWHEVGRARTADAARAHQARREPLPFEVRAVGELMRSFGQASSAQNLAESAARLVDLRKQAADAHRLHGDEPMLGLLATQTELFVEALARWEAGADTERELAELGGNFLQKAGRAGWVRGGRRLVLDDLERRTLYRIRWVDLAGLRERAPFSPTPNHWRIYYRFLLDHPERESGAATRAALAEERLRYVSAVEKADPDYPGLFARGVLYFELGRFQKSAEAFRGHLLRHRGGPWQLRAQNHLVAAEQRAAEVVAEERGGEAPVEP